MLWGNLCVEVEESEREKKVFLLRVCIKFLLFFPIILSWFLFAVYYCYLFRSLPSTLHSPTWLFTSWNYLYILLLCILSAFGCNLISWTFFKFFCFDFVCSIPFQKNELNHQWIFSQCMWVLYIKLKQFQVELLAIILLTQIKDPSG